MPLHHPSTSPEPFGRSPATFFEAILPKVLAARADVAKALGGRLLFDIGGADGGCWCVDLAEQRVFEGAPSRVDCTIVMSSEACQGCLMGSLDVAAAVRDRAVRVQGDLDAFQRFTELLA